MFYVDLSLGERGGFATGLLPASGEGKSSRSRWSQQEYGRNLESNLEDLSERLGRMAYRPKPVLRRYIPKPGSRKKRPLGLPSFEDKIVQKALTRVLEQIYEADFLDCSYGYRPDRTQHQALAKLGQTIQRRKVSWVVDADVQGFFDHLNQEWLLKFLEQRIGDKRVWRLVWRILKSGVMEDGLERASEEGTPQGGSLSALLSNVYLHYVLDLWFERRFKPSCRGEVYLFRYADDFLVCFQHRDEAEEFLRQLKARLEQFHLVLALLHNSGRVTDRSQSCLNAIEFALTQACPGLTYDSVPHI